MTWPRYLEILEYWAVVPPLAECVAGFTGATGKAKGDRGSELIPADDSDQLMQDLMTAGFPLPAGF